MLEMAGVLAVFLCAILAIVRQHQVRQRALHLAKQEQIQRGYRTIQHCDRIISQSSFTLPHSMQILFAKRKLRCLWAMIDLGETGLNDSIDTQNQLICDLERTRHLSTRYHLPADNAMRKATMQTLFLLSQYIQKELKTRPAYAQELINEKMNIDEAVLRAKVGDLLLRGEIALTKLSPGSARVAFEGAINEIAQNPQVASRLSDLQAKADAGLSSVRDMMQQSPMLEDAQPGVDGLDRMFSIEKARWA